MNKSEFYARYKLTPDTANIVNAWGAVQSESGKYLLQCWDSEKKFIKKEVRTDNAVMVVKILSPQDLNDSHSGGPARSRTVEAIRNGAQGFVAVSTGVYPNWIESANLDQVYPVLTIFDLAGETFARVGVPVPTGVALST
jgi:hypothetical protein